jgi:hypothetical protein
MRTIMTISNQSPITKSKGKGVVTLVEFSIILLVGAAAIWLLILKSNADYDTAKKEYISSSSTTSHIAAKNLENSLKQIYQNLRTISLLPSVRGVTRHAENLSSDGLSSIQQIYNNLASNVNISEVYIVPENLNSEIIDTVTGKPEEPIKMFDELITYLGKNNKTKEEEAGPHYEEVEIYEYRLMVKQFDWLRKNYPNADKIDGLNLPMISGPNVITCDNTEYNNTKNDKDRIGLVFMIPFYDLNGPLKGGITGIIRNNNIKKLLPDSNFSLVNKTYD